VLGAGKLKPLAEFHCLQISKYTSAYQSVNFLCCEAAVAVSQSSLLQMQLDDAAAGKGFIAFNFPSRFPFLS
jgi:hypothetical protein